jgi:hypothetical protein
MPRLRGVLSGTPVPAAGRQRGRAGCPPPTAEATALAAYKIRHARLEDVCAVAGICAEVFIHEQMFKERLAEEEARSIQNIIDGYTDRIRAETASKLGAALERKREVSRPRRSARGGAPPAGRHARRRPLRAG